MSGMRAMVLDQIRGPLAVREVPDPVPPDGGVVVRVLATGLCRSDWHAWAGHDEIGLPHVPGHELAGVVAVPDGVTAEAAASLGCRFATAYRALTGRARLAPGEWVTVIGAGGVGLSAVMIAKALGARDIPGLVSEVTGGGMAAADYPAMLSLIERGVLRPQNLIERVIGLNEACALLPALDMASPAGMTMIDPSRLT
jgi:D-arabinose 1-dehydrogenase-like Zn-dependent alcohol dehydrogenase